jgi:hypothetical protein
MCGVGLLSFMAGWLHIQTFMELFSPSRHPSISIFSWKFALLLFGLFGLYEMVISSRALELIFIDARGSSKRNWNGLFLEEQSLFSPLNFSLGSYLPPKVYLAH